MWCCNWWFWGCLQPVLPLHSPTLGWHPAWICRNQLSPVPCAEQFLRSSLKNALGQQADVGIFHNNHCLCLQSIPDFIADEVWGWVWVWQGSGWPNLRIFPYLEIWGDWCSYDNVAILVFHQKTLNVFLFLAGFLAVKFGVSKWILALTLLLCSVNSETLILTQAGMGNSRKIQMCVCLLLCFYTNLCNTSSVCIYFPVFCGFSEFLIHILLLCSLQKFQQNSFLTHNSDSWLSFSLKSTINGFVHIA